MKQFAVIGMGRFGSSVATTLNKLGHEVMAIDSSEEKIQGLSEILTHAVTVNAIDEQTLKSLGIRNFDVVIVSIGKDMQASILVTLNLKELGVKNVVAKAQNEMHGKILEKVGADKVIYPERDMGVRVAHKLISSCVLDYIELSPEFSIVEITPLRKWLNKSLKSSNLRGKYGANVMAIRRKGEIIVSPKADEAILEDDILVVIGKSEDISKIEKMGE